MRREGADAGNGEMDRVKGGRKKGGRAVSNREATVKIKNGHQTQVSAAFRFDNSVCV